MNRLFSAVALVFGFGFASFSSLLKAADDGPSPPSVSLPPYGISQRALWTTSTVVGSPNPPPPYQVKRAFPNLKVPCPMAVAHEPGTDNLLLIHQMTAWNGHGKILRLKDDDRADSTQELLSLDGIAYGVAFHPDYQKNGYLFVGDNGPMKGDKKKTRITRYTVSRKAPFEIAAGSAKVIIEWASNGHNGGDLAFGTDGLLYITSGDGTSDSDTDLAGQDLSRLLAKVLRIDVDHPEPGQTYAVPKDNPFVAQKDARPETWAYGFRNPWRIHVDQATGDVWVGQNGQDLYEQVYLVARGANYGWSVTEGGYPFYPNRKAGPQPISKPLVDHHHSEMRSLTGGVVYRGEKLPDLKGAYVYGDWSTGRIWGVRHDKGKVVWHQELAVTTLQITGFGLDGKGELLVVDHGGGLYRLEPTPKQTTTVKFPAKLSETGIFRSVKDHQTHAGLIPYSVNAPLWSDGADKERFIGLVGDAHIDFTESRGWNFPDGTVLVKTFSLPTTTGKKRIETRLLTRQLGQWAGYSYQWNNSQDEAELVAAAGVDQTFEVRDADAPGGVRKQTWHYPSRVECMACHSRAANWVLGLSTLQMNKVHDYGAVKDNQLRTLEHLGLFRSQAVDHFREARKRLGGGLDAMHIPAREVFDDLNQLLPKPLTLVPRLYGDITSSPVRALEWLPKPGLDWLERKMADSETQSHLLLKRPDRYGRLVDPSDKTASLDARARSYLHANCAHCHVEAGGGNAAFNAEFTVKRDKTNLFDVKPMHHTFDLRDAKLIAVGHPEQSVLLHRLIHKGTGQMPPLATSVVDQEAAILLREWIAKMK
jgi:glucose/arabinose dehydrogenase